LTKKTELSHSKPLFKYLNQAMKRGMSRKAALKAYCDRLWDEWKSNPDQYLPQMHARSDKSSRLLLAYTVPHAEAGWNEALGHYRAGAPFPY
jgi:hypothetical protein